MGALRQSRSFNTDMTASHSQQSSSISGNPAGVYVTSVSQGLPTLIVMIVVLVIILMFCFWGAPAVRAYCRRKICCCCPMDEPNLDSASIADGSATPTIILLPYGRMLVVDRTVFAQLQADHTGIDFMELSANLIRAQRLQTGSNPSILESDATSKGLSPTSIDFLPPAYDDIFGNKNSDLPPSYSEISMMFRKMSAENSVNFSVASVSERNVRELDNVNNNENNTGEKDAVNNGGVEGGIIGDCYFNASTLRTCSSAPFVFKEGECEFTRQLKEFRHGFSSLENNVERTDPENDYKTDKRRRSAENNGAVEEICSGSGFNQNAINKRFYSGPKVGNCSSPVNDLTKNKLNGENTPAPSNSVQYLQSCNERRCSKSDETKNAKEFVDRESSV